MKKRNKKYNPTKFDHLGFKKVIDTVGIFQVGEEYCNIVNINTLKSIKVSRKLADIISNNKFEWSVLCCVMCANDNERYMKAVQVNSSKPMLQSELTDFLREEHKKLLANCNENHLVEVCWIAAPNACDFDEPTVFDFFESLNVYEGVENYEI